MRRKLLVIALAVFAMASWAGSPSSVSAHDVERDGPDFMNTLSASPFIGNVAGFNKAGGGFTIHVAPHGRVVGFWQCSGSPDFDATVYSWTNTYGTSDRVISVSTLPDVQSTTYPGAMQPGTHCWFTLTATRSADNVYNPIPFDLTDTYWWGDIPAAGGDPNPEPTPTPTPTPSPTPTPTPAPTPTLCTITSGSSGNSELAGTSPQCDIAPNQWWKVTGPAMNGCCWLWATAVSGGASMTAYTCSTEPTWGTNGSCSSTGSDMNFHSDTACPMADGTACVRYMKPITSGSNRWKLNWWDPGGAKTVTWQLIGGVGVSNPSPSPTPTPSPTPSPTPTASPTPTPRPPGTYYPPPNPGAGFDVCDSTYSASEKLLCQPDMPEVDSDMCEGPDDADLAVCQPAEEWEGPTGGGGGGDDGSPGGGGTGSAGFGECPPTPIEAKVGYAAPDEVPDVDDLAARVDGKDPIAGLGEAVGWIGDMVWTLPNRIGNGLKWVWNQGVNAVVPGECLDERIAARWETIQEAPPFSIYFDVAEAVDGATSSASSGSLPTMPLPGGGSFTFPLADIEDGVAPYRGAMGAAVWLFAAIAAMRIVVGSFGVGRGKGEDGS
jgi:hypothetical protein